MSAINLVSLNNHRFKLWKYFLDISYTIESNFNTTKIYPNQNHGYVRYSQVQENNMTSIIDLKMGRDNIYIEVWGRDVGVGKLNYFSTSSPRDAFRKYTAYIKLPIQDDVIKEMIELMVALEWLPYIKPTNLYKD